MPDEITEGIVCPIPLEYIDVTRTTHTNIKEIPDNYINGIWYNDGSEPLSVPWTGKTMFRLLKPEPKPGASWVEGHLTRSQTTTRPDNIHTHVWPRMRKKDRAEAIHDGVPFCLLRDNSRLRRGTKGFIPAGDKDHAGILSRAKELYGKHGAPTMPLINASNGIIPPSRVIFPTQAQLSPLTMLHTVSPITEATSAQVLSGLPPIAIATTATITEQKIRGP